MNLNKNIFLIFLEIISDKSSLIRLPMNEVRDKCFKVFQSCLQSESNRNTKLIQLTVNGLQTMVRQQVYWTVNCKLIFNFKLFYILIIQMTNRIMHSFISQ